MIMIVFVYLFAWSVLRFIYVLSGGVKISALLNGMYIMFGNDGGCFI